MTSPSETDAGLSGRVAIVTGGSRGIGRAIVELLAAAGMDVVLTYRQDALAAAEVVAAAKGLKVAAEPLDVRDATACSALAEKVVERAGTIDLLVNNAGIIRDNPLTALEDEDIRIVLETNTVGAFNITRAVAPHMVAQRRGKIINVSSVSGEKGGRGQTNYAASKGALNAFTRALAVELAPRGITVNAVAPGVIDTRTLPRGPGAGRGSGAVADSAAANWLPGGCSLRGLVPGLPVCGLHHGRNNARGWRI